MTYRVPIVEVTRQFHRAHTALVESLGGSQHLSRTTMRGSLGHWQVMEQNWQKKYNAKPVNVNGSWKWLDFSNEKQYTLFMLKWS